MSSNLKIKPRFLWLLVGIVGFFFLVVGHIDRTPIEEQSFYQVSLDRLKGILIQDPGKEMIQSSWAKINITPTKKMPMAGYKRRDHFDSVHDSLYARIISIKVGKQSVAMINIDLLLFPPELRKKLERKMEDRGLNFFFYLSATHTHNGVGAWDDSVIGELALGDYDEQWVETIAEKIISALSALKFMEASIRYWESDASDLVVNRLAGNKGEKDGILRGMIIERTDSSKAILFAFSAHATTIRKEEYSLSCDYPGRVIENLQDDFDFGMYMAGMVGSHSFASMEGTDYELVNKEGDSLTACISNRKESVAFDSVSLSMTSVPIEFGPSQLRISKNWKANDWVLASLFGKLTGDLTYLKIGNILMIATPCDFSGEIFVRQQLGNMAEDMGLHLIITSFNGNYTGYITHDGHYDSIERSEVRIMNWVGPYYGKYFGDMIKELVKK